MCCAPSGALTFCLRDSRNRHKSASHISCSSMLIATAVDLSLENQYMRIVSGSVPSLEQRFGTSLQRTCILCRPCDTRIALKSALASFCLIPEGHASQSKAFFSSHDNPHQLLSERSERERWGERERETGRQTDIGRYAQVHINRVIERIKRVEGEDRE